MEGSAYFVLHNEYHLGWSTGNTSDQGISSNGIHYFISRCSVFSNTRDWLPVLEIQWWTRALYICVDSVDSRVTIQPNQPIDIYRITKFVKSGLWRINSIYVICKLTNAKCHTPGKPFDNHRHIFQTILSKVQFISFVNMLLIVISFYPAALKGSGVLSYPERAGGRAGGRADKPR